MPHLSNGSTAPQISAVPEYVPVRMLTQFAYCPRLGYLEWVQGEWAESAETVEGTFRHRRVDNPDGSLSPPDENDEETTRLHARSVSMGSDTYGLIARIDLIETEGRAARPVDYKRGGGPRDGGAWTADRIQVCAQALILRDNGYSCDEAVVYYCETKQRVDIPIDNDLVTQTLDALDRMRAVASSGTMPPPLVDDPKCQGCSLAAICLPDEVRLLSDESETAVRPEHVRQFAPPADTAFPLYVQEQGASIGKDGETLVVKRRREVIHRVRLIEVSQVCLWGNVQITTQALRELSQREIPVCYFTYGGWFVSIAHGMSHKNVELRQKQFSAAADTDASLALARSFVDAKIRNCRTMLRRNHTEDTTVVRDELQRLQRKLSTAKSLDTLLGLEGAAARTYFAHFPGMLKTAATDFEFLKRNRRPPQDPVNALLSLAYALLVKDITAALLATGFDPYMGFLHQPKYGRPALALDIAEEFRPLIGDSVVLHSLNSGILREEDFVRRGPACNLTSSGRQKFLRAYEQRMQTEITHPLFGYRLSYRRLLFVQARLLVRYLLKELPKYPGFVTR